MSASTGSKLIDNERVKLRATALNTTATSCFAIGVLAPMAASFYNLAPDRIPVHLLWSASSFGLDAAHGYIDRLVPYWKV